MYLPHVSLIFKKIGPKTFGLHCVSDLLPKCNIAKTEICMTQGFEDNFD